MMTDKPFPRKCPECRKRAVSPAVRDYSARIEHDGRAYDVSVQGLPVLACTECGEFTLPPESEKLVSDELRSAAGLLTPEEIRDGRKRHNLTQKALAEQLDIAEATLSRWETGAQVQQRAFDKLLRAYFDVPELRAYLGGPTSHIPETVLQPIVSQPATNAVPPVVVVVGVLGQWQGPPRGAGISVQALSSSGG